MRGWVECVGIEQGKTWGRKGRGGGGRRGPCMGFQPPESSETTPLAQTQEFICVSQSPEGISQGTAWRGQKAVGVAVKSDFRS